MPSRGVFGLVHTSPGSQKEFTEHDEQEAAEIEKQRGHDSGSQACYKQTTTAARHNLDPAVAMILLATARDRACSIPRVFLTNLFGRRPAHPHPHPWIGVVLGSLPQEYFIRLLQAQFSGSARIQISSHGCRTSVGDQPTRKRPARVGKRTTPARSCLLGQSILILVLFCPEAS